MTDQPWDDDDVLLSDLSQALAEVLPQAARVAEQGRGALAWRTVDQDLLLASLSFDSDAAATVTRSTDTSRMISFSAPPLSVELEVTAGRIVGQLSPPSPAEVLVEGVDGVVIRVEADEFGFFLVSDLPSGPVRLRCDTPTGRVVTEWVRL